MDEQPVRLVKDTRLRLPRIRRVDYEPERASAAFMFCKALSFWCRATARKRKTKVNWAEEVASLLEGRYANCEHPCVDNLDTHIREAFYAAFEPARALVKRAAARRSMGAG